MDYTEEKLKELEELLKTFLKGEEIEVETLEAALPEGFQLLSMNSHIIDVDVPDEGVFSVDDEETVDELLERVSAHAIVLHL